MILHGRVGFRLKLRNLSRFPAFCLVDLMIQVPGKPMVYSLSGSFDSIVDALLHRKYATLEYSDC
jgi:hypothetical protein